MVTLEELKFVIFLLIQINVYIYIGIIHCKHKDAEAGCNRRCRDLYELGDIFRVKRPNCKNILFNTFLTLFLFNFS